MVDKPRNNGQWTEARFNSFIRSALRGAWTRWSPNHNTKKDARVSRGLYRCEGYGRNAHNVEATTKVSGKRKNNVFTDHIKPVGGNGDWNKIIEGMFCEQDNLQLLCKECHDRKTKDERDEAKQNKSSKR